MLPPKLAAAPAPASVAGGLLKKDFHFNMRPKKELGRCVCFLLFTPKMKVTVI